MIGWFEKHNIMSFCIALLIAILIFFVSSIQFPPSSSGTGSSIKATLYHILAFFLLASFLLISLVQGKKREIVMLPVFIAVIYGIFDELHQFFIPGRGSSISDVLLDSFGIFIALTIYLTHLKYRKTYTN